MEYTFQSVDKINRAVLKRLKRIWERDLMLKLFIYLLTSYLFVQFFFSIGYAVAFMVKETDPNKKIDKIFKHFVIAILCGALSLYLLIDFVQIGV
ncbi:hypothetical protein [Pseudalkalibacillus berkeleyi]|uniref:Uncharacterized protein n=1 Tax=Pseudalkalibacillus berkeleyi TaxID=1069813 RepID=A0ABS9H535_9BACL|nr:hypothetical protein [Pseudalkalibacillus berkeleyi]MCF6138805.1 hypothetical protein [Pseudalkalibacillus berkeleyi]